MGLAIVLRSSGHIKALLHTGIQQIEFFKIDKRKIILLTDPVLKTVSFGLWYFNCVTEQAASHALMGDKPKNVSLFFQRLLFV